MRLFISYARVDKPLVTQIATLFTEAGYDVWVDHRLLPGENWKEILFQQISQSDVFVYALSPESVNSEWCQWEFAKAIELGKRILPILLQKNTQLPAAIKQYQYADFSDTLDLPSVARLMGGLARITGPIPPGSKLDAPENPSGTPAHGSRSTSAMRIVAGPGTGKTTFLMRRIAELLEQGTDPHRILLVTFTRTAARDIEKALENLKASRANQIRKGTLHSFCYSVLQQANVFLQTGRTVRTLLKFEERFLLEDLWSNKAFGDYYGRRRRLKAFEAAWAREQDQEPGWPLDKVDGDFQTSLSQWLRFHQAMLIEEIIPETLKYLRNNPACSEIQQYDYVLVDEYQDLNRAEQNLVRLLSENGTLIVVGDEDQAIYEAFRYAHPESMYQDPGFSDGIPLTTCYRCPTQVVDMANNLIQINNNRMGRVLIAHSENGPGEIHIVQWPDMDAEAKGIAQFIGRRISTGHFEPGEVLILCPRRQFGYAVRDALKTLGHPVHSFFHEEHLEGRPKKSGEYAAQEAFALLTLVANRNDRVALRCWLGFGHNSLRREQYHELREYCNATGVSSLQALDSFSAGRQPVPRTIGGLVERYKFLLERLQELEGKSAKEILPVIFPIGQEWAEPFHDLADGLDEEEGVSELLEILRTGIMQPELPTDVDYIRVMSLHKSKGLNANHVIVTGCIEGLVPMHPDTQLPPKQQERYSEEQRRLFYVAITRPRQTLVISNALSLPRHLSHRMRGPLVGGDREVVGAMTSSFIAELGPQYPTPVRGLDWRY